MCYAQSNTLSILRKHHEQIIQLISSATLHKTSGKRTNTVLEKDCEYLHKLIKLVITNDAGNTF